MSNKVYVVTAGRYSDYRIIAIYTRRQDAERVVNSANSHDIDAADVEEFTLDELQFPLNGMQYYSVEMSKEGIVRSVSLYEYWSVGTSIEWAPDWAGAPGAQSYLDCPKALRVQAWAKDEKHAIKITNEIRTMLLAENKWQDGR